MSGPNNLVSARLRDSVIAAGYAHPDGTPNKRGFARAMCLAAGDQERDKLQSWEQNVYRWLDAENPSGMSDKMAELAARVLGKPMDYFKEARAVQQLLQENLDTAAVLERLETVVEQLSERLRHIEDALQGRQAE